MAEPAPLITITDPQHPAPFRDDVPPEPGRHWSWRVRALALAVVLLLTVGVAAATDLRAQQRLRQRAERVAVAARLDPATPPRLSGLDRMAVAISFQATDRADLLRIAAPGGWVPIGFRDLPLQRGTVAVLELEHRIDCAAPVTGPATVTGVLRVTGARDRRVLLRLPEVAATEQVQGFACGEVDAADAVRLVTSQVLRHDGMSTVTAQLSNVSRHPVTVRSVGFPGFALISTALPLTLPARAPGLLVEEELPTHPLVLDAQVRDCGTARAALDNAAQSGFPDILTFAVDGVGGMSDLQLRVAGVETYLEAEWRSTCVG